MPMSSIQPQKDPGKAVGLMSAPSTRLRPGHRPCRGHVGHKQKTMNHNSHQIGSLSTFQKRPSALLRAMSPILPVRSNKTQCNFRPTTAVINGGEWGVTAHWRSARATRLFPGCGDRYQQAGQPVLIAWHLYATSWVERVGGAAGFVFVCLFVCLSVLRNRD